MGGDVVDVRLTTIGKLVSRRVTMLLEANFNSVTRFVAKGA